MNQSKLEVNTCSSRKVWENMHEWVTIGFGFTSDWMKKWCKFLSQSCSIVMQNQLLFDTQMKTTQLNNNCYQDCNIKYYLHKVYLACRSSSILVKSFTAVICNVSDRLKKVINKLSFSVPVKFHAHSFYSQCDVLITLYQLSIVMTFCWYLHVAVVFDMYASFLPVTYSILNTSAVILKRNETRLGRNKTRGGNLLLSGTVVAYLPTFSSQVAWDQFFFYLQVCTHI